MSFFFQMWFEILESTFYVNANKENMEIIFDHLFFYQTFSLYEITSRKIWVWNKEKCIFRIDIRFLLLKLNQISENGFILYGRFFYFILANVINNI